MLSAQPFMIRSGPSVLIEKFIGSCMPDSEGMIHGKAGGGD